MPSGPSPPPPPQATIVIETKNINKAIPRNLTNGSISFILYPFFFTLQVLTKTSAGRTAAAEKVLFKAIFLVFSITGCLTQTLTEVKIFPNEESYFKKTSQALLSRV
jgi:hypothetical protein